MVCSLMCDCCSAAAVLLLLLLLCSVALCNSEFAFCCLFELQPQLSPLLEVSTLLLRLLDGMLLLLLLRLPPLLADGMLPLLAVGKQLAL